MDLDFLVFDLNLADLGRVQGLDRIRVDEIIELFIVKNILDMFKNMSRKKIT